MSNALAVSMGVLALVGLSVSLVRAARPRRRPLPRLSADGFRTGPLWSWCPAEKALMPHQVDAGRRRCHSCKTTTPVKEQGHG